jgi:hypothetical protein
MAYDANDEQEELIELAINLPFWLKIEGSSAFAVHGYSGSLSIVSIFRDQVAVPGLSVLEGGRLLHDDTNYIAHSRLVARTLVTCPKEPAKRRPFLFYEIPKIAVALSNLVINAARLHLEDYILRALAGPHELHGVSVKHLAPDGTVVGQAEHSTYVSAITNDPLVYTDVQRGNFSARIEQGLEPHLHQLLFLDAQTYRLKQNPRMAAANLSLALESELFFVLTEMGVVVDHMEDWTMNRLAIAGLRRVFGAGLDNPTMWGEEAVANFELLKRVRDRVMHKGQLTIRSGEIVLDLNVEADLERVFDAFTDLGDLIIKRAGEKQASSDRVGARS